MGVGTCHISFRHHSSRGEGSFSSAPDSMNESCCAVGSLAQARSKRADVQDTAGLAKPPPPPSLAHHAAAAAAAPASYAATVQHCSSPQAAVFPASAPHCCHQCHVRYPPLQPIVANTGVSVRLAWSNTLLNTRRCCLISLHASLWMRRRSA